MNKELQKKLKEIAKRLKKEYGAQKVILYGSYARGEETEDSDTDLFVIAQTDAPIYEKMATAKKLIRDLRNGLPVSIIVFTSEEIEKKVKDRDAFITTIMEKGVAL
ncbi:MAG: nucleotidyltransferase domain-containing protein [Candidatus Omnitrophica bacterium]|nr:nucleotidyltransferase domain-containing protein [Candidatus Omnitrophota bacterium]